MPFNQTEAIRVQETVLRADEVQDLRTLQWDLQNMNDQDSTGDAVWFLITADALRRRRDGQNLGPDPVLRELAWEHDMCAEHGRDLEGCADDELPHTWPLRLAAAVPPGPVQ